MAFDNQLGKGKDWRKPYYPYCQQVDWTCRNGGSCKWCSEGRQFANKRRAPIEDNERKGRMPWHFYQDKHEQFKYARLAEQV